MQIDKNRPVSRDIGPRGDRLSPRRSSRLYWHLTQLRAAIESVITACIPNGSRVVLVDYGCGNAPYKPLFDDRVEKYVACDFPGNAFANTTIDKDGTLPLPSEIADVVLSSQVLEHVAEPAKYLAESYRVLKSNGVFICSTHGAWRYHPDPCDFRRWTSYGLRYDIERIGFSVEHFVGVMGPAATALQLWQDAILSRTPSRLQKMIAFGFQQLIQFADRRCSPDARNRDACVYVLAARKRSETMFLP
jgi:SAM-dependent methyltransferase